MRQRDIGDRRVDRLHDRRQHDRNRDGGAIDCRSNTIGRSTDIVLSTRQMSGKTLGLARR
jgi:hypothetical protein